MLKAFSVSKVNGAYRVAVYTAWKTQSSCPVHHALHPELDLWNYLISSQETQQEQLLGLEREVKMK